MWSLLVTPTFALLSPLHHRDLRPLLGTWRVAFVGVALLTEALGWNLTVLWPDPAGN